MSQSTLHAQRNPRQEKEIVRGTQPGHSLPQKTTIYVAIYLA